MWVPVCAGLCLRSCPLSSKGPTLHPNSSPHCAHAVLTLYPYCTHSVPTLYPHCTHTVPTLYPLCTHTVPTLYPHCTHTVPKLYPRCTHTVATLYPLCAHTVPTLHPRPKVSHYTRTATTLLHATTRCCFLHCVTRDTRFTCRELPLNVSSRGKLCIPQTCK